AAAEWLWTVDWASAGQGIERRRRSVRLALLAALPDRFGGPQILVREQRSLFVETVRNLGWDQVDQFAKNLSSKRIANWVFAAPHSLGATFHAAAAFRKTRNKSFVAASSLGKWPRVLTARRSLALSDSIAFVV